MRLVNRPLAFILAAAVTVACVILIIEVIAFHIRSGPLVLQWTTWYDWASRTRWNQLVVEVWSAILIVIGLLILALELKPRRLARLRLHSRDDAIDVGVTRAGLARSLRAAATGVDGISAAAVPVRRGRARIVATAAGRGRPAADALSEPVTQRLQERLDGLGLHHPPRIKVRVTPRSR